MKVHYALIVFAATILAGCEKTPVVSESIKAQTVDYYLAHIKDAESVKAKCEAFATAGYTTMSPSQQNAWLETADGINCRNSGEAVARWARMEYNRKHTGALCTTSMLLSATD